MRFQAQRARLAEVAALVGQAVSGKSTKKIFECLRIVAKDQELEISGTDLEVAIRYRIQDNIEVSEPGEVVVPAHLLANVLREIGDETVTMEHARQKLTLKTDGGLFELECEDPSQYPDIPEFPVAAALKVGSNDVRALVRKTVFAAGREAARFVLNGVRILASSDSVRFVATDGRRLATLSRPAMRDASVDGPPDAEVTAIVGVKGLQHFDRVAAETEGEMDLALADRFVSLRSAHAEVVVRVMEGTFPEVDQIIPDQCKGEAQIPVGVLASRLRQVRQFASVESQAIVMQFSSGELSLSAAGGDGRAEVRLGVDYEGDDLKIGFNPAFLLDSLKVVDSESIQFGFNNANAAARISDGSGFLYVIMPVLVD